MLRNYLITALRSFRKNFSYTLINVLGLSLGLGVFLLMIQHTIVQKSFDRFHTEADHLYRVSTTTAQGERYARSYGELGPTLKQKMPEIRQVTRLDPLKGIVEVGDRKHTEEKVFFVDPAFLQMFDYPLIQGNREALDRPDNVVISADAAAKYFGQTSPMNQVLEFNEKSYQVSGVVGEGFDSHLQFDFLFPIDAQEQYSWEDMDTYTYIMANEQVDPENLEAKIRQIYGTACVDEGCEDELFLQPLQEIYLHSDLLLEAGVVGDGQTVNYLIMLAFLVLLVAWFNFVSLSSVTAMNRSKEVGTRLAIGGKSHHILSQFMVEYAIINMVVFGLATLVALWGASLTKQYLGLEIPQQIWGNPWFWAMYVGLLIISIFVSGFYPALVMSRTDIVMALKGTKSVKLKGGKLRRALTTGQFVASIFLIIATVIAARQISFLQNQDLGFEFDGVVCIRVPAIASENKGGLVSLKSELQNISTVEAATVASLIPGIEYNFTVGDVRKNETDPPQECKLIWTDYDYVKVFGMDLVQGAEAFSVKQINNRPGFVINETAARAFAMENVEENFESLTLLGGNQVEVVSVVKDYYHKTAKNAVSPTILGCFPLQAIPISGSMYYMVRIEPKNIRNTLYQVEQKWRDFFPMMPFEYFFLDDKYNEQYRNDRETSRLFIVFAVLSILISAVGLFALTLFNALQRLKEVAIRRILGAKLPQIVYLFLKDILILVGLANLIAWPLTFLVMDDWLDNFALQIGFEWWWYLLAGCAVAFLAGGIVSYHSLKVARLDPAQFLRYE